MTTAERRYFDILPCYLTVQDRDLFVVDANEKFTEHFGDYKGRRCYQVYKQRSEPCEACPVLRTFHDGECHTSEEVVYTTDGREISVIVYTTPLRNEQGEILHVIEQSTDITEVKRLQRQLRESQERYKLLFDAVPSYISIQDRDLRLLDANRRFREDFGHHFGRNCFKVYKHRDEECLDCPVQKTFDDGKVHQSEEVVTSKSGEQINILVHAAPLLDARGQIQSVMEVGTNITPIRQLQSQLESIGMLISTVSHGIKGQLNGLDGGMYLVNSAMERGNKERLTQGWEMVKRNIDRIRGMVLNILYYAKEREPGSEEVLAWELAEEVCTTLQTRAREHRITLERLGGAEVGTIEVDPRALRSLLVNLVENSLDACRVDSKKDSHSVTVEVVGNTDKVQFVICDNGIGMDQETREKAFSLFFSSKGSEGTGLGLFIANKIALAHGGRIEIASELDQGTSFTVTIPRRRSEARS